MDSGTIAVPLAKDVAVPEAPRKKRVILLHATYIPSNVSSCLYSAGVEEAEELELDSDREFECDDFDEYDLEDNFYSNRRKLNRGCAMKNKSTQSSPRRVKAVQRCRDERRLGNISANNLAQKKNTDKMFDLAGVKRRGLEMYFRRIDPPNKSFSRPVHNTGNTVVPTSHSLSLSRKRSPSTSHKVVTGNAQRAAHPAAIAHMLHKDNIPKGLEGNVRGLIDIQHREITADDYELLLLLENTVAPRTIDEASLNSLRVMSAQALCLVGEFCTICMELFEEVQKLKILPCQHSFHSHCIDHWLSSMSQNCPLDGLAVFST